MSPPLHLHGFFYPKLLPLCTVGAALGSHALFLPLGEELQNVCLSMCMVYIHKAIHITHLRPSFRMGFQKPRRPTRMRFYKVTLPEEEGDMQAREDSGFGTALSPTTSCCGDTSTCSKLKSHTK